MRWLLRLYPATWRERYGDEFLALIESQPRSPRLVADVLLGALDAWLRPQVGPRHSAAANAATVGGGVGRRRARFDKFTPRSRAALQRAQAEAESFRHGFIGTEHLLLGLLHDSDNLAVQVLEGSGVNASAVRQAVEHQLGEMPRVDPPTRGLTARSKRAIELSVEEANRLRHTWVGTEHLLLGLLREHDGAAAGALRELGCGDIDELRRRVVRMLNKR